MDEPRSVVVVGGGLAAATVAQGLREGGFTGAVTVIGEEREQPYERPPLSKGYLAGANTRSSLRAHPPGWYGDNHVDLLLGSPVTSLDLEVPDRGDARPQRAVRQGGDRHRGGPAATSLRPGR